MHQIRGQIKTLMIEGHPGHRHGEISTAVVAVGAGDDLLFVRLSQTVEIEMNDPDSGVVRHRTASPEEDMI